MDVLEIPVAAEGYLLSRQLQWPVDAAIPSHVTLLMDHEDLLTTLQTPAPGFPAYKNAQGNLVSCYYVLFQSCFPLQLCPGIPVVQVLGCGAESSPYDRVPANGALLTANSPCPAINGGQTCLPATERARPDSQQQHGELPWHWT